MLQGGAASAASSSAAGLDHRRRPTPTKKKIAKKRHDRPAQGDARGEAARRPSPSDGARAGGVGGRRRGRRGRRRRRRRRRWRGRRTARAAPTGVLPFGEGMTRPDAPVEPQRQAVPDYTREALEARVQGLMIVKCVITTEGSDPELPIIKPLPHMEQAVLDCAATLEATRRSPSRASRQQVGYVFNFKLEHGPASRSCQLRTQLRTQRALTEARSTDHAIHAH